MTSFDRPRYVAHDVADLYNALPAMFGFRPERSLVAIATSGPRQRFGFRLRLDLPAAEDVDDAATVVVGHLRNHGAEGVVVLALGEDQDVARDLNAAIEASLGEIEPVVVARSDGHRYWVDVPGFPREGIAYETSDHHAAIVGAVVAGQQIAPSREAVVARFAPPTSERRQAMAAVLERLLPDVLAIVERRAADLGAAALDDLEEVISHVVARRPLDDDATARLCLWANAGGARDALWASIGRETASCWLPALAHACRSVGPPFDASVLSLASFAAWQCGDGAQALIAAERSLAADPAHEPGRLMRQVLVHGVPPTWWRDRGLRAVG